MKRVNIEIDERGKIMIKTEGFQGEACVTEVEKLINELKSLGVAIDTENIQYTPEYYVNTTKQKIALK